MAKVQRKTRYTMSSYVRKITLERRAAIVDTATADRYAEILRLCRIISQNINQITKAYNAFSHTKVHISQTTRQAIADTLNIVQTWRNMQPKLLKTTRP